MADLSAAFGILTPINQQPHWPNFEVSDERTIVRVEKYVGKAYRIVYLVGKTQPDLVLQARA